MTYRHNPCFANNQGGIPAAVAVMQITTSRGVSSKGEFKGSFPKPSISPPFKFLNIPSHPNDSTSPPTPPPSIKFIVLPLKEATLFPHPQLVITFLQAQANRPRIPCTSSGIYHLACTVDERLHTSFHWPGIDILLTIPHELLLGIYYYYLACHYSQKVSHELPLGQTLRFLHCTTHL